ncbi:PREDICTED: kinesin-like protein KIF12 [Dufourea novaeangliae]|uniref:Kinesin-like protein n=1 Tax=Dufourea novaeangliae TaxID=178035 RepID=A0A154PNB6_DUFNO|nr:PREDICTED: kinesin-like protein KIF12 [Dufourea novaeangliae]KZC13333.1 Kinesin-like protein KIF12 [Dufourea novaeangliae]
MVLVKNPSPPQSENTQRENAKKDKKRGRVASRGNSPSDGIVSRGNSPGKRSSSLKRVVKSSLLQSRGSETGSIERLVDGDKRVIATKHLLPENNINVVVRVRPLSGREVKAGDDMAVQFPGDGQIYCEGTPTIGDKKGKLFSYNVVFEPTATQEDILQFSGVKKLIEMAVEGFNCTAFCYGQTGSGKSHTLTGPPGMFERMNSYSEDNGLVFRSFVYLFKLLQERRECNFVLRASFLEIYNEKVIDLLNPGTSRKPLMVRWSKKTRGFFVENLFTVECEELDDLLAVLEEGMRNRSVGAHNMNDHSSRSHSILTVNITSEQQMDNSVFISRQGKINFVDLAGSEMTKKTQSEGKTLEEANNINKSLMVLGYCISSLSDGKRKGGHIPYRDSKLTKLLADSLAGNGVTLMIACVSPARSNGSETLNTLRYAARVKKIRTKPIVVMDPREALILSLKREVGALQTENEHLRAALHLNGDDQNVVRSESKAERKIPLTPPVVDLDKLSEMERPELSQLIHAYITENEALRRENAELYATREQVIRDQELVCRENERLLKKLEDVNSVCCRSPIIPARPTYSAEMLNDTTNEDAPGATNVWTNPNVEPMPLSSDMIRRGLYRSASNMPEKIQKELDKRRIVGSYNNIAEAYKDKSQHRRHNSWDNGNGVMRMSPDQTMSPIHVDQHMKTKTRRTSTVPEERRPSETNELLGEPVQPTDHFNESPDSILSGSLEMANSAPDTAESEAPTAPFPPVSHTSSPFGTPEPDGTTAIRSMHFQGNAKGKEDETSERAFGSPVPIDEDKPL